MCAVVVIVEGVRGVLATETAAERAGVGFAGLGERVVAAVEVFALGQLLAEEVLFVG